MNTFLKMLPLEINAQIQEAAREYRYDIINLKNIFEVAHNRISRITSALPYMMDSSDDDDEEEGDNRAMDKKRIYNNYKLDMLMNYGEFKKRIPRCMTQEEYEEQNENSDDE